MQDLTFTQGNEKFNYRVCAIMLSDGKLLAMRDEPVPYYYLPGGRVRFGETAEAAVLRELQEELGISPEISRPLWLNQAFFTEDVQKKDFHELCLYFLVDITKTDILSRGEAFQVEENGKCHSFHWLDIHTLQDTYFYPLFLKTEICHLPDSLTLRTEYQ